MTAKRHFAHMPRAAFAGGARPHFGQIEVLDESDINDWFPFS
jgi:hypothetical protein